MSADNFEPDPPAPLPRAAVLGPATFYVDYLSPQASSLPEWHFRVHRSTAPNNTDHWFDLVLVPLDDKLRSATIDANMKPWYLKQGISGDVLRYARHITGMRIVSSSNKAGEDEWRTPDATRVWQRMPAATYDSVTDRYTLS